jgi:UPF0716 family protein affecting phage T7 exclusion
MSDIERRRGSRMTRSQREQRAYQLVLATGTLTVASIAAFVLAMVGVVGSGLVVLLAVLAVVAGLLLRRTLRP